MPFESVRRVLIGLLAFINGVTDTGDHSGYQFVYFEMNNLNTNMG